MSTKFFHFDGGVKQVLNNERYAASHGGNPIEYGIQKNSVLCIQAWHAIPQGQRTAIIARLTAAGWVEGEQSKPD